MRVAGSLFAFTIALSTFAADEARIVELENQIDAEARRMTDELGAVMFFATFEHVHQYVENVSNQEALKKEFKNPEQDHNLLMNYASFLQNINFHDDDSDDDVSLSSDEGDVASDPVNLLHEALQGTLEQCRAIAEEKNTLELFNEMANKTIKDSSYVGAALLPNYLFLPAMLYGLAHFTTSIKAGWSLHDEVDTLRKKLEQKDLI